MASQSKFNVFTHDLCRGAHLFQTHTYKVMLTNTAPVATNAVKTDLTEITAASGYASGGPATTVTEATSGGVETISGTQLVITAAAVIGPFRYAALYNDTQTTPAKPLVSWFDYGAALTLQIGDSLTIQFNSATPGTIMTVT